MQSAIYENTALRRFELALDQDALAAAYYRMEDGVVVLFHTEVPFEYSGQGVATKLADAIFPILRARGQKVLPTCEFMKRYVAKHPEWDDLLRH